MSTRGVRLATQTMTITAYAKHRGVSRQAVYDALNEGRIKRAPDGRIDPVEADRDWRRNTGVAHGRVENTSSTAPDEPASPTPGGGGLMEIAEAERVRRHYAAERERIAYEAEAGKLIPLDDTLRMWATVLSAVRTRILSVPTTVGFAARVMACQSEADVRSVIEEALHAALSALSDDYRGADAADPDDDEGGD